MGSSGSIIDDICSYHVKQLKKIRTELNCIKLFINIKPLMNLDEKKNIIDRITKGFDKIDIINFQKIIIKKYTDGPFIGLSYFDDDYKKCKYIYNFSTEDVECKIIDNVKYDIDDNDKKCISEYWCIFGKNK